MFVAANVTANSWFRSWRLDLTENQLYSLSRGTQQTLNELSEPVQLTLYYSRDAAAPLPQLQAYASRVREMLQTFQARSRRARALRGNQRRAVLGSRRTMRSRRASSRCGRIEGADPIYFGLDRRQRDRRPAHDPVVRSAARSVPRIRDHAADLRAGESRSHARGADHVAADRSGAPLPIRAAARRPIGVRHRDGPVAGRDEARAGFHARFPRTRMCWRSSIRAR